MESRLFALIRELQQNRMISQDVARFLNPEIMALMIEESQEEFDKFVSEVFSHSFAATQISRLQQTLEPITTIVRDEARQIRLTVPDNSLLRVYRQTGLSSESCQTVSEILRDRSNLAGVLQSISLDAISDWIELLVDVVKDVPEFDSEIDPAVNRADATRFWLNGESVAGNRT